MSRRRRPLLVPEARAALDQLKGQASQDAPASHSNGQDKGNWTTREAGEVGGQIGGTMVKKLIRIAEESLRNEQARQ